MNAKVILFLLGKISLGIGLAQFIPLLLAIYYSEACVIELLLSMLVAFVLSLFCGYWGHLQKGKNISVREGIGTVFFAWILAAGLAGLPYYFIGILDPASAYFESMSGLTTTGATSISDLSVVPQSILFWRSLTHWIGGIGIIVLFVALLPQISGSAVYLFNAEVSGFSNSKILPRLRNTAITLFYIYLFLTVTLTVILVALNMSLYDAVNHAFSAIATGGFSVYNESIAHFNNDIIKIVLGFFMLFSGGNFALYYQLTKSGVKVLWQDLEFKTYVSLALCFTVLVAANIIYSGNYGVYDGIIAAFFHVSSFASTTGYVADNYDLWPSFSKLILAVMYITGGCAGSTAGGVKICRVVVLIKTVAAELRRTLHPQMLLNVYYDKKRLSTQTIINISRFFFIYILVIAVLSLILAFEGMSVEESIFGIASCVSSVGPAFGSIGAVGNFSMVPPVGKLACALAMLLGRLELFTALALLRSEYWRSSKRW